MLKIAGKKPKTTQYIIGGVVAVVILLAWISIPLMNNSSLDSAADPGSFFRSRTADVSSLGSEIPSEGGAPGYSLSGEMLNNPATSGENIASSLFQSGPYDESAPEASDTVLTDGAGAAAPAPRASASASAPDSQAPKGKLSTTPPPGAGGGGNSMTAGGAHNKFFGSGAANARAEVAPLSDQMMKKATPEEKRNAMVAMLKKADDKSALAAKSPDLNASRGSATGAFEKTSKADTSDLNSGLEQGAASSGLALGAAAQDLKRNDPQLSKSKVTLPEPKPVKDDKGDEEIKKMIIQMLISSVLGPMFQSAFAFTPVK